MKIFQETWTIQDLGCNEDIVHLLSEALDMNRVYQLINADLYRKCYFLILFSINFSQETYLKTNHRKYSKESTHEACDWFHRSCLLVEEVVEYFASYQLMVN